MKKVKAMKEAAYDALRSKRAKSPKGEGTSAAPSESNVGEETLHEISANKLIDAAKAAEVKRGKAAVAGDKETAKKAIGQNKKFYDAAKSKRMKESADRMKERDPGSAPQINERVPYAAIVVPERKGLLQGDRIEHPDYIIENNLQVDYLEAANLY